MQASVLPPVSIVLPTFNRADCLATALASCLSQTHANLEVIVVDDGSTDHTAQVVAQVASSDPRVRYVWQEHQKLPAALNTGHRAARGEYLTWTSDDNLYEPEAIERMVSFLETRPMTGMVYGNVRLIGPEDEDLGLMECLEPAAIEKDSCFSACFLYRRAVYSVVGEYALDMFLAEDYEYWLRVSRRFRIAHLPGPALYRYRLHASSLASQNKVRIIVQCARARCRHVVPRGRRHQVMAQAYCLALYVLCLKVLFSLTWRFLGLVLSPWPSRAAQAQLFIRRSVESVPTSHRRKRTAYWLLPHEPQI